MSFLNQAESIYRRFLLFFSPVILGVAAVAAAEPWRDAAEYLPLFAPPVHRDAYRASVSASSLEAVLAGMADDPTLVRTPGAWAPRLQAAVDAFGQTGGYDRWKLARLYGSRQALVARGARVQDGRVTESWTLISPYPDPALTSLESGTLLLVVRLP